MVEDRRALRAQRSRDSPATGGGSWRGLPVRSATNDCCCELASSSASSSVSAAKTLKPPSHRAWRAAPRGGSRGDRSPARCRARRARNARRRRRAGRAPRRAARRTVLEPRIHSSHVRARARRRDDAGLAVVGEIALQLHHVLREGVGVAVQRPAHRARDALVRSRRAAEAEVDAAGEQRVERAELLGDHQRRVVGQHDAARADADACWSRRRHARSPPRSRRWRCRVMP